MTLYHFKSDLLIWALFDAYKPVICEKKTYTVAEIMQILGIGRTAAYDLTRKGLFKVIRVGKILRINKESFDQWFDSQQ